MRVVKGVTFDTDDDYALRLMVHDFMRYCHEDPRGFVPGTVTIHYLSRPEDGPPYAAKMTWEAPDADVRDYHKPIGVSSERDDAAACDGCDCPAAGVYSVRIGDEHPLLLCRFCLSRLGTATGEAVAART